MVLYILRGAFILLVAAVAALYLLSNQSGVGVDFSAFVLIIVCAIAVASIIVALDVATRRKRLSAVSGIFLGIIAGLIAAYALSFVVDLIGLYTLPQTYAYQNLLQGVKVLIGLVTCYLGISLVIQTKDDFRFVIPYVELAKQIRGQRPTILDTSVIVDGRVLDIVQTRVLQGLLIVPKFVLDELQAIADSADKLRRARGRRGLDILKQLQDSSIVEVHLEETDVPGAGVDQKLIALALENQGRIMTNDYNLNKVATLRGVEVININDLAKALKPVVLPGEPMSVRLAKPGESPTQGVGYLEDGTMVVVEGGRAHLGDEVNISVTSTLQTSAGRMIFGQYEGETREAATPPLSSGVPGSEGAGMEGAGHAGASAKGGGPRHAPRDVRRPPDGSSHAPEPVGTPSGAGEPSASPASHKPATGRNPRRVR